MSEPRDIVTAVLADIRGFAILEVCNSTVLACASFFKRFCSLISGCGLPHFGTDLFPACSRLETVVVGSPKETWCGQSSSETPRRFLIALAGDKTRIRHHASKL